MDNLVYVAPSRERELKHGVITPKGESESVAPSRERELKHRLGLCLICRIVAPSRERELKPYTNT